IEEFKVLLGIRDASESSGFIISRFLMSGPNAVLMFFVLSGFLITYLMLVEIERTDTLNIKKFYVRRSLRIWPLYYW
ncbi:MAG: acyltransferase, partial [Aggregatilineales bacterium]